MSNQLIILGNGFDRSSGLKSSYEYFVSWILDLKQLTYEEVKQGFEYLSVDPKYPQSDFKITDSKIDSILSLNIWLLLLVGNRNLLKSDWANVEEQLKIYLDNGIIDLTTTLKNKVELHVDKQYKIINLRIVKRVIEKREQNFDYSETSVFKFYLSELNNLESYFEKFLFEKAGYSVGIDGAGLQSYFRSAKSLLEKLVKADIDGISKYNIMSFNYTDPWDSRWNLNDEMNSKFSKPTKSVNVHGQALHNDSDINKSEEQNRIIFGIDNKNINPNNVNYLFTKTFRTLVNYSDTRKPLDAVNQNIFDKDISIIKFFGHSLGEADYSYFQQMFDYYDLYNNDSLKLYFILENMMIVKQLSIYMSKVKGLLD